MCIVYIKIIIVKRVLYFDKRNNPLKQKLTHSYLHKEILLRDKQSLYYIMLSLTTQNLPRFY